MHSRRAALAVTFALLAASGCTSNKTLQPNWSTPLPTAHPTELRVTADDSRLIVSEPQRLLVLDGSSGLPVASRNELYFENLRFSIGGASGGENHGFRALPLERARLLLIVADHGSGIVLAGLDLVSGEELWRSRDFPLARELAAAPTDGPDGIGRLLRETADGRGLYLQTQAGLVLLDARTGAARWQLRQFQSAALTDLVELPGGDHLLMGAADPGAVTPLRTPIARLDPNRGRLLWITEHSGDAPRGMRLSRQRLVVDATPTGIYDLASGRRLWHSPLDAGSEAARTLVTDNRLYLAAPGYDNRRSRVLRVSHYGLDGAGPHWSHELPAGTPARLTLAGDRLLLSGEGAVFDGRHGLLALSAGDGGLAWRTPPLPSGRAGVEPVGDLLVDEREVYLLGASHLYGFELASGERRLQLDLQRARLGAPLGLAGYGDWLLVIAREGVVAYRKGDGSQVYRQRTPEVTDWHLRGHRLILLHDDRAVSALDIERGELAGTLRYRPLEGSITGSVADGVFVNARGDRLLVLSRDRKLTQYRLP